LQELLIGISTKYINADLSDIDELVRRFLKQIDKFVSADRGNIFFMILYITQLVTTTNGVPEI
jgi:hypothetical protein